MNGTTLSIDIRRVHARGGFDSLSRSGLVAMSSLLFAQTVFLFYLLAGYGRTTLRGDVAAWARFGPKGWIAGDAVGNTAMGVHLLMAALVMGAGILQVLPVVRRRAPVVHRWSGRVYLVGCMLGAVTGLTMLLTRGTVGDVSQHVAIGINALLVLGCAIMAWRAALRREFTAHNAWAMRTLLVANGVLFFRLLLSLWLVILRAPVGFDMHTFSGPFLTVLAFTVYVFGPLAVHESYRAAERSPLRAIHLVASATLYLLAVLITLGTFAATLILWLPKLRLL